MRNTYDKESNIAFFFDLISDLNFQSIRKISPSWLPVPSYLLKRKNQNEIVEDCGKGIDDISSFYSMLFEAIERFSGENFDNEYINGSYISLKDIYNICPPDLFNSKCEGINYISFKWVKGKNLLNGKDVFVPADTIYFPHKSKIFPATTIGLAANSNKKRAIVHAIYEVIEQDTIHITNFAGLPGREIEVIKEDGLLYEKYKKVINIGIDLKIKYFQNDINIPVFATFAENIPQLPSIKVAGLGCNLNPIIAATRSFTECCQALSFWRLRFLQQKMREGEIYHPPLFLRNRLFSNKPPINLNDIQNKASGNIDEDLNKVLLEISKVSSSVICIDITNQKMPFPAVKIIILDFENMAIDTPRHRSRAKEFKQVVDSYLKQN